MPDCPIRTICFEICFDTHLLKCCLGKLLDLAIGTSTEFAHTLILKCNTRICAASAITKKFFIQPLTLVIVVLQFLV